VMYNKVISVLELDPEDDVHSLQENVYKHPVNSSNL
jgi:hypothetical protein